MDFYTPSVKIPKNANHGVHMTRQNQVSFKMTDESLLQEFKYEAKRRGISIHEYGRQMAILGHSSLQNDTERNEAILRTTVTTLATLRRLVVPLVGAEEKQQEILTLSRQDAEKIISSIGGNE